MKVLYFGTVCDLEEYEKKVSGCQMRPSIAPIVFESTLLSGMKENNVEIDVYSFPMLPSFPFLKELCWGNKKEHLKCGYNSTWIRTINVPFAKQVSRRFDGCRIIKKWIKENEGQRGVILTYSMPPFLMRDIVKYSKKYGVKCFAIVTDLLRDMYINSKDASIVAGIKRMYLNQAIKYQSEYDGYVYLTEAMHDVVAPDKPYIVMEGIADTSNIKVQSASKKADAKVIMYAGLLYEKYGIINLLEAFTDLEEKDIELWLFGDGDCIDKINDYCIRDRRIKFFGRRPRKEILEKEREATILINVRNTDDEFTKYSFPSKTIEYMLSGTPLLTTKLSGIPEEYFDYVFSTENNSVELLTKSMKDIFEKYEELGQIGNKAQKFICENKNSVAQAKRVIEFMEQINS